MDDLRHGVGLSAHAVLDRVEQLRAADVGCAARPSIGHLTIAKARAQQASRTTVPINRREFAIDAAAHALRAAELLDGDMA